MCIYIYSTDIYIYIYTYIYNIDAYVYIYIYRCVCVYVYIYRLTPDSRAPADLKGRGKGFHGPFLAFALSLSLSPPVSRPRFGPCWAMLAHVGPCWAYVSDDAMQGNEKQQKN